MRKRLIAATMLSTAAVAFATITHVDGALASQPQARPIILSAELLGNNLIVEGVNFDENATVLINDKMRNTIPDADFPRMVLKAKKGGKKIRFDEPSVVQVSNGDGQRSNVFSLFRTDEFVRV